MSCDEAKLIENIKELADAVSKAKPTDAKDNYIQRVALTSTMGQGVKVDPSRVLARKMAYWSAKLTVKEPSAQFIKEF